MMQKIAFESEGKGHSNTQLLWRGIAFLVVAALVVAVLIAKSNGDLDKKVPVTAVLVSVGDGLPAKSDVKFRGVLVGMVTNVTPSTSGGPNYVHIDLKPDYAHAIADTVTARVVPSNVFAVSSVQLIDNGGGTPIDAGAQIREDTSLPTVVFQTALTKLREIVSAVGRGKGDDTLGVLAAVAEATDRRGTDLVRAGGQLDRIVTQLNGVIAPDGGPSTLSALSDAVQGLQTSAPDLLDALHNAVVPLRTIAEKKVELTKFLAAGLGTFGTLGTALDNNTDKLIGITTNLTPVVGVLADNGNQFVPIFTRLNMLSDKFFREFWNPQTNLGAIKAIVGFTPHRPYTRVDCPRYGVLEGPSCSTAPTSAAPATLPPSLDPRTFQPPPSLIGGNVGPVGSPQEKELLTRILGGDVNAAGELLLGPLARGTTVHIAPDPNGAGR